MKLLIVFLAASFVIVYAKEDILSDVFSEDDDGEKEEDVEVEEESAEGSTMTYAQAPTGVPPVGAQQGNTQTGTNTNSAQPAAAANNAQPTPPSATANQQTIALQNVQNIPATYTPTIVQQMAQGSGCFAKFSSAFNSATAAAARTKAYSNLKNCLTGKCHFKKCNKEPKKCLKDASTQNDKYGCWDDWFNCVSSKCSPNL